LSVACQQFVVRSRRTPYDTSPGVPLADYRRLGAAVRLTCRDCKKHRDLHLDAVIERLTARGAGDERNGIRALARLVRRPCERCGGRRFVATPAFRPSQR
jgi:hypothetical protein